MASRFTALPLSSGESFILETDHGGKRWVILVDGGQSKLEGPTKNGLYKAVREHCPEITDTIDIAICTHRDHDHAGGFPAFIKTWLAEGNDIGEFWLPGGWAGAVEYALTNPDRLASMLHEGANAAAYEIGRRQRAIDKEIQPMGVRPTREGAFRSIQSMLHDQYAEAEVSTDGQTKVFSAGDGDRRISDLEGIRRTTRAANSWGFSEDDWEIIRSDLETSELHAEPLTERAKVFEQFQAGMVVFESRSGEGNTYRRYRGFEDSSEDNQLARSLFRSSLDTAEAIREISSAAAMFDIPVRWFDFPEFEKGALPSGGLAGFLKPLNAVELTQVRRETDAKFMFFKLTLTEQNVASLVFQRVETDDEPGVLFLGDSRLAFGIDRPVGDFDNHLVQPDRPVVYTAAHHGSRNNDHAYKMLGKWLAALFDESIAVRNGGVWNQTLSRFLGVTNRRCAQCYQCHGSGWSQLVQINTDGRDWSWPADQGGKCGVPKRKM
ncbi:MAG: hypothetical protein H6887_08755 [Hoeflea sp.]|nr:hypothetical protein [Hoeflea sp.]